MIYITGDTHGDFTRMFQFCNLVHPTPDDIMIVLGDAGLNYYNDSRDKKNKYRVCDKYPITFFCIHGNHEMRPWETECEYKEKEFYGGTVYYEEQFPTILFAKDGEIYNLPTDNGVKSCLVIGGAYSVDKFYRISRNFAWFESEQPSDEIKQYVEDQIAKAGKKVDIVLSHTCPLKYEPIEAFLPMIDQSTVDKSTEEWLDKIENELDYQKWYCGHYHIEKKIDKLTFMYGNIVNFE